MRKRGKTANTPSPNYLYLKQLMLDNYQVRNLVGISPVEFKERLFEFLELDDAAGDGGDSSTGQRGRSVRFTWPYDHDFGDFEVGPRTGNERPIRILASYMNNWSVPEKRLDGKRVLDIGFYAGGTSLLLAAMGAEVTGIEEVKKYVDCLTFLRDSFDVKNLDPRNLSLYDLTADEFQDQFDMVHFSGVLYHLSDPVLGMRIVFDSLRPGGICLLETATAKSKDRILEYAGKNEIDRGRADGANWFYPSPLVVSEMMDEVGFCDIRLRELETPNRRNRTIAIAVKAGQVDMLRAGLSVPNVR
jgi:SAM-dependent methyltransferase